MPTASTSSVSTPSTTVTPSATSPWQVIGSALKWLGIGLVVVMAVIGTLVVAGIGSLLALASRGEGGANVPTPLTQKVITSGSSDVVAIVNLAGEIGEDSSSAPFGGGVVGVSARRTTRLLDKLKEEDQVKAIVLRIDSPGGGVVASDEIYRKVKEVREAKPIVVSMGNVAASGGYYIAAGANQIIANPATLTGSIGVIAQFPEVTGLFEKIGVEMRTFKSGEFKDIGSPNREITPAEVVILNTVTTQAYDQFVTAIAEGRGMDIAKVRTLGDGRVYTGQQAKDNGLVDQLGTLDDAVAVAGKMANVDGPTISEYSDQSFFQALFESKLNFGVGAEIEQLLPTSRHGLYYLLEI